LAAFLFAAPLIAVVLGGLFAAVEVGGLVGGGALVWFPLFLVFTGLIGFYVSPHAEPQITKAMLTLLEAN